MGTKPRAPLTGRANYPNLQHPPHAPNAGRGRLQVAIRRAFMVGGDELTSSQVYDWAYSRHRSQRRPMSEAVRWSVHRILLELADRVRRVPPHGAWLWRLKRPAAENDS
jgi:hypothetical protein